MKVGDRIEGSIMAIDDEKGKIVIMLDTDEMKSFPSKATVDWSAMPKWAKWVAMDKNGEWFWSDAPPRRSKDIWECSCNTDIIPPEYAPKYEGPWEDSLMKRPEGE